MNHYSALTPTSHALIFLFIGLACCILFYCVMIGECDHCTTPSPAHLKDSQDLAANPREKILTHASEPFFHNVSLISAIMEYPREKVH